MPNYCDYEMCVRGYKDNVDEFIKIIQSDYNYSSRVFTHDRHFFRVFQAECSDSSIIGVQKEIVIWGYCAWSVVCCMFPGPMTYYDDHKNLEYMNVYDSFSKTIKKINLSVADKHGTHILNEAKRLNLQIEIFSVEPGMAFAEHYRIMNGICTLEESTDYYELCCQDFDNVETMREQLKLDITQEMWDKAMKENDGYLTYGGFYNNDGLLKYNMPVNMCKHIIAKKV